MSQIYIMHPQICFLITFGIENPSVGLEVQMLQTCFGIYIVLALFTFLFFWGTLAKVRQYDEENEGE